MVTTTKTADSLSVEQKETWREIRKELEEVGITVEDFNRNKGFIIGWIKQAFQTGDFEERPLAQCGDSNILAHTNWEEPKHWECPVDDCLYATGDEIQILDHLLDCGLSATAEITSETALSTAEHIAPRVERLKIQIQQSPQTSALIANNGFDSISPRLEKSLELAPLDPEDITPLDSVSHAPERPISWVASSAPYETFHATSQSRKNNPMLSPPPNTSSRRTRLRYGAAFLSGLRYSGSDLLAAATKNQITKVQKILNASIPVNYADNETLNTALHIAVRKGHVALTEMLLDRKADVRATNRAGMTPLHSAVLETHGPTLKIVPLLVERGADIEAKAEGDAPLHTATLAGNVVAFQILLDAGANIKAEDSYGRRIMRRAATLGKADIVKLCLDNGEKMTDRQDEQASLLQLAAANGHLPVVELLLEHGADVNVANQKGRTALIEAVTNRQFEIARSLLDHGADLEATEEYQMNALNWAVHAEDADMVRLLAEHGADVDAKGHEWTALHAAASDGRTAMVEVLLEKGANVDARDGDGRTALHVAVHSGNEATLQMLLDRGANTKSRDKHGVTALGEAMVHKNKAMVRILESAASPG